MPRTRLIALIALSIVCGFSFARPWPAQEKPPSFRVTTRLVELTVVAIDKHGNAVTDLKKEDFAVFDNGKPRKISLYRYEGAPAPHGARAPVLPQFVFTNRNASDTAQERNITALVLDFVNTDARNQMFVKAQTTSLLRDTTTGQIGTIDMPMPRAAGK